MLLLAAAVAISPRDALRMEAGAAAEYYRRSELKEGALPAQHRPAYPTTNVFSDTDRYGCLTNVSCFRIPSVIALNQTHLIAFVEARLHTCSDSASSVIVSKHSFDSGTSWSGAAYVTTGSNPTAVYDRWRNVTLMYFVRCKEARTFYIKATNEGREWSVAHDLTASLGAYRGASPGPGAAAAFLPSRSHPPRYLVPLHFLTASRAGGRALVLISDDGGSTHTVSTSDAMVQMDESSIVHVPNSNVVVMYMRNAHKNTTCLCKARATSVDGGLTWGRNIIYEPDLPEPVCEGSAAFAGGAILFAGPSFAFARAGLRLWSTDPGSMSPTMPSSWTTHHIVDDSTYSGYSSLAVWDGQLVGILWGGCQAPLPFRTWCAAGWKVVFTRWPFPTRDVNHSQF